MVECDNVNFISCLFDTKSLHCQISGVKLPVQFSVLELRKRVDATDDFSFGFLLIKDFYFNLFSVTISSTFRLAKLKLDLVRGCVRIGGSGRIRTRVGRGSLFQNPVAMSRCAK